MNAPARMLLILILLAFWKTPAQAAFEINKLSPEAAALDDAFSALGRDPWAILYNPAQVLRMSGTRVAFAYSRPEPGFGDFQANLGGAFFTRQAFQAGYGAGLACADTNVGYREMTGLLNLGRRFGEPEDGWDLALGTNLKVLSLKRGDPERSSDPALAPQTLNRFTADAGLHLRVRRYYLGVAVQNIVPANFGVLVREDLSRETRIGLGGEEVWEAPRLGFQLSPAVELALRNRDAVLTGGLRCRFLDLMDFNLGLGARELAWGFTLELGGLWGAKPPAGQETTGCWGARCRLSVGYQYPLQGLGGAGSPLLGLSFLF